MIDIVFSYLRQYTCSTIPECRSYMGIVTLSALTSIGSSVCPSSKQLGLLSLISNRGYGSSWIDDGQLVVFGNASAMAVHFAEPTLRRHIALLGGLAPPA
jgi:hypothetical protein